MLSTLETNLLYSTFFTTSFFTTLLSLAKLSETGVNFGSSNLSISAFKLAKFVFDAKVLISTCDKSVFVA